MSSCPSDRSLLQPYPVGPCTARVLLAACVLGASSCGSTGSDAHGAARPAAGHESAELSDKSKRGMTGKSNEPKLDGTRCAAFVPFLPSTVEGFRAKGPAEGSDIDLGEGAALAVLRRGYWKPGSGLDLEIVDTERGKRLRDVFENSRELDRSNDAAVIKAIKVQGHKAVAQWNSTSKAARVSILLSDRYLVNLNLRPEEGVDRAIAIAEKLELAELAALQPSAQIAAQ